MTPNHSNPFDDLINLVMRYGTDAMAQAFASLLNHAMLIEHEQLRWTTFSGHRRM